MLLLPFYFCFFFSLNTLGSWKVYNVSLLSLFRTASQRREILLLNYGLFLLHWRRLSLSEFFHFFKLFSLKIHLLLSMLPLLLALFLVAVALEPKLGLGLHFLVVHLHTMFA